MRRCYCFRYLQACFLSFADESIVAKAVVKPATGWLSVTIDYEIEKKKEKSEQGVGYKSLL